MGRGMGVAHGMRKGTRRRAGGGDETRMCYYHFNCHNYSELIALMMLSKTYVVVVGRW